MKNREIDWSYLWLQQFDEFWICSARNDQKRKLCEFSETYMKKFVKSHHVNFIFGVFGTFGIAVPWSADQPYCPQLSQTSKTHQKLDLKSWKIHEIDKFLQQFDKL